MTTYRTAEFWAPALHANTLLELSVPEPGPSNRDPVVRPLPIKYGDHQAVGVIKRMIQTPQGLLVADDQFRVSTLSLPKDEASVPIVTSQNQVTVPQRGTSTWTGLAALNGGAVSALSTGRLTLYRDSAEAQGSARLGANVLTLSTPSVSSNQFVVGGRELELGLFDAERAFTTSNTKATDMAPGEVWRAKNVPHNNLQLRVPVHHLCSTFLNNSSTDIVTGTKGGNVRRYDTRQRKPVGDWKVAREGGVGCVAPSQLEDHTLFFSDHSSLIGALDLRNGKMAYTVPGLAATAHYLSPLPAGADWTPPQNAKDQIAGLATVSSDATLRVCGVTSMPDVMPKGNWGNGKKASVLTSVGGVGVGSFVFREYGSRKEERKKEEGEDEDEEVDDDEEEELWEGMGEAADSDSDDEPSAKRRRT